MTTSRSSDALGGTLSVPKGAQSPRLGKEERRELLARVERSSARVSLRADLQRTQRALDSGDLQVARQLVDDLEKRDALAAGLPLLRDRLERAEAENRQTTRWRQTEELLTRYIQQRKRPLAELACDSLAELAPNHPRLDDYRRWIRDLEGEVAEQEKLDAVLKRARGALESGRLDEARRQLKALRKVDVDGLYSDPFARQLEQVENDKAEQQGIERGKQRIERQLEAGELLAASREIEALAALAVPKITLDFLRQRLAQTRARLEDQEQLVELERRFRGHLEARNWDAARDVAHEGGRIFPQSQRPRDMFDEVHLREAEERRGQSLLHGINTLEKFIAAGRRSEAELALTVLDGLQLDPSRRANYVVQIARLQR